MHTTKVFDGTASDCSDLAEVLNRTFTWCKAEGFYSEAHRQYIVTADLHNHEALQEDNGHLAYFVYGWKLRNDVS